jgi:hypothetical protein
MVVAVTVKAGLKFSSVLTNSASDIGAEASPKGFTESAQSRT